MTGLLKVIRLGHTDAAGRVFTPKYFELAHEGIEQALSEAGFPLNHFLDGTLPPMPIVHAEGNFSAPLALCDEVNLEISWFLKGNSSVNSITVFKNAQGKQMAEVKMTHVCIDAESGTSTPIPDVLRDFFVS